ncbi:MAG TPA: NlpC/P60 family protein, partial [Flavitalea sp.]|nr:NlpC/P60 family protein [Flavitalea sp.]
AEPGDLAFFDNAAGKITHVGLLINNQSIIHSSGIVRIDPINQEGIINADTGKRTHNLHIIRRYF